MANLDSLVPDPSFSDKQYERYTHLDICHLEYTELEDEYYALRSKLWGLPRDHWLRERVEALEAEIVKRKGKTVYEFKARPKPKLAEGVKL